MTLIKYKEPLLIFSFILVLFLFLFGGVLGAGYVLDDHSVIQNRVELKNFSIAYKAFLMPWHQNQPWAANYRPLTLLSYALTLSFSESTAVMRFINIVIHSVNAALVFYLVLMFFSRKIAYSAAIGFAVLPINIGTILSLVGRSDLLSAFFMLLSVILFFKNKYGWSSLSFFIALLAKDFSIFLLPVIILLFLFFPAPAKSDLAVRGFAKKYELKKIFKAAFNYILVLAPYFILRYLALGIYTFKGKGSVDPIISPLAFVGLKERISTGFIYFYLYLRKTFIPVDLSPDYSFNQIPIPKILSPNLIIGSMILLAILLVFFKSRDQKIKIPIILFLVPFGVISNTIFVTTGVFAERWWYFPSIGLVLFASVLLGKLFENQRSFYRLLLYPSILTTAFFYLYVSFGQAKIWTNERRLFAVAVERSPNSAWARTNLAAVYFKEKEFDRAQNEIEYSLKISEKHPLTWNIYAKLKWREGEFEETESAFKRAIEHDLNGRNNRDLYRSLAILKLEVKNYNEALSYIKDAISSTAFGDIEKAVYLDNLLRSHINSLSRNQLSILSESENNTIKLLTVHVKGFK